MEKIDETLVKKAQTGDIKAFEEIFKKTNKRIYNFLLHLSSDSELAADLGKSNQNWECAKTHFQIKRNVSRFPPWGDAPA